MERGALDGIPGGVDGAAARWVDLDSEGIAGVLVAEDRGWYYKANLGGGHLAPPALLRTLPVPNALGAGVQQLTDLAGEGRLDLVQYMPPTAGYFERTSPTGAGGRSSPSAPSRRSTGTTPTCASSTSTATGSPTSSSRRTTPSSGTAPEARRASSRRRSAPSRGTTSGAPRWCSRTGRRRSSSPT